MKSTHKSVHTPFSQKEMFELVADVKNYATFLPWCDRSRVLIKTEHGMRAEVGLAFSGLRQSFITENTHTLYSKIDMKLVEGPFSKLDGTWLFHTDNNTENGCTVELYLNYKIKSILLSKIIGPAFEKIASSLVDSFVKRAHQIYKNEA